MSTPADEFYSEDRWANWLDRLREEDFDPDDEDSARVLLNLQDDVAIAVAKVLRAHDDDLGTDAALAEVAAIRDLVLADPGIDDEETALLVDGVQTSLVCVFASAEQYVADGVADEAATADYLEAASEAEVDEEFDRALALASAAGTRVIDGDPVDLSMADDLEYGLVTEWINGLDSLRSALSAPEVIEE